MGSGEEPEGQAGGAETPLRSDPPLRRGGWRSFAFLPFSPGVRKECVAGARAIERSPGGVRPSLTPSSLRLPSFLHQDGKEKFHRVNKDMASGVTSFSMEWRKEGGG